MEREVYNLRGDVLCFYGDLVYFFCFYLMVFYWIGEVLVFIVDMEVFNLVMSFVRVLVEWLFGDIFNLFKFLDFKKNLKLGLSVVGK